MKICNLNRNTKLVIPHKPEPTRSSPRRHNNTISHIKTWNQIRGFHLRRFYLGNKGYLRLCGVDELGKVAHLRTVKAPALALTVHPMAFMTPVMPFDLVPLHRRPYFLVPYLPAEPICCRCYRHSCHNLILWRQQVDDCFG